MTFLGYCLEVETDARLNPWSVRVYFNDPYLIHFIWWKLSIILTRGDSTELIRVCGDCSHEVHEVFAGDEGWTVCDGCGNVEGPTEEITYYEYERRLA